MQRVLAKTRQALSFSLFSFLEVFLIGILRGREKARPSFQAERALLNRTHWWWVADARDVTIRSHTKQVNSSARARRYLLNL